jgi:hypothetical protein
LGNFSTTGNVDESGDTVDYWTASLDGKTLTWKIAYSTASYLASASTTAPSGGFTADGDLLADYFLAQTPASTLATQIVNNAVITISSGSWDLVKPILTTATVADAVGNNGKLDRATLVFNTPVRDSSIVDANATLGGSAGTFTTGDANDVTTVFNLTDANALAVDTSATGAPSSFLYSNLDSKFITDLAGNLLDTTTDGYIVAADAIEVDGAAPIITAVAISKNIQNTKNTIEVTYSEIMTFNTDGWYTTASGTKASDADFGEMTVAGTIDGVGAWAGGTVGNVANHAVTDNSVALDATNTILTITLNGQADGLFATTGTTPANNNTFSPEADDTVLKDQGAGIAVNRFGTVGLAPTVTAAWDLTPPAQVTGLAYASATSDSMTIGWTVIADPGDFSRYVVYQRGTTGVTLANGTVWNQVNDASLSTRATTSTTLTGLNSGTIYFMTMYASDAEGNVNTAATAMNGQTNAGAVSSDRTPPAAPSAIKVESKGGKAVLTWTDPTASDLASVVILRGKNEFPVSGTTYATVAKGLLTYTDNDVVAGDTVKYMLRGKDTANNESVNSAQVSVVIVAAAATGTTPDATTPDVTTPDTTVPDAGTVTDDTELTPAQKIIQKKIDKLNKTIGRNTKSIEKYTAKIGTLDATKKADKKKIARYTKSIKNWNRLITRDQATVLKLEERLGQ